MTQSQAMQGPMQRPYLPYGAYGGQLHPSQAMQAHMQQPKPNPPQPSFAAMHQQQPQHPAMAQGQPPGYFVTRGALRPQVPGQPQPVAQPGYGAQYYPSGLGYYERYGFLSPVLVVNSRNVASSILLSLVLRTLALRLSGFTEGTVRWLETVKCR